MIATKLFQKVCSVCGNLKNVNEFYARKLSKDGCSSECKKCAKARGDLYRLANKNKIKERSFLYYEGNKEIIKAKSNAYYRKNIEVCKQKRKIYNKGPVKRHNDKIYRQTHKEEIKKYKRVYWLNNKEKIIKWNKEHYNNPENHEKRKIYMKKYMFERYHNNINFRIKSSISSRIYSAIKNKNKSKSSEALIGCTIDHLKKHIESKFKENMSWDNYGEWHIDHIIPCAFFDLSIEENQQKCFHYTNLQPLWAKENISKSDNINF